MRGAGEQGSEGAGGQKMIGLQMARRLKDAGLQWNPAQGDRFAIPDRGLDDRVFVINDMATIIELYQGDPMVTFHGTPEWALDAIYLGEAVWLPDEGQLRGRLQEALELQETPALREAPEMASSPVYDLLFMDGYFTCRFTWRGRSLAFRAEDASASYAAALLHVLGAP